MVQVKEKRKKRPVVRGRSRKRRAEEEWEGERKRRGSADLMSSPLRLRDENNYRNFLPMNEAP